MKPALPRTYRVAIIEDHRLQRRYTERLVATQDDFVVTFSGESVPAFKDWLAGVGPERYPHVIILDLLVDRAPSVDVEDVTAFLASGMRIMVLSALASPVLVRRVVQAGVDVIVGKRDVESDVLKALRTAARGEEWVTTEMAAVIAADSTRPRLSVQEENALVLYASGMSLGDVAAAMNVQPDTAKQYLNRVRAKYTKAGEQARSKVDLSRLAWRDGYVDLPTSHARPTP